VAGLTSRTRLASAALPDDEAKQLEERVRESQLLARPAAQARPSRHADQLSYAVTVDDGGRERTHRFVEDDLPDEVRSLIEWVDEHPAREHEVGPPG